MDTAALHSSVVHATFNTTRDYPTSVRRVFAAFADPELRALWNSPADEISVRIESHGFNVGERTVEICVAEGQDVARVETFYVDIVDGQRILFLEQISDMERLQGASLVTAEFFARNGGTRLSLTIQTAGVDGSGLEQGVVDGWASALERLEQVLKAR